MKHRPRIFRQKLKLFELQFFKFKPKELELTGSCLSFSMISYKQSYKLHICISWHFCNYCLLFCKVKYVDEKAGVNKRFPEPLPNSAPRRTVCYEKTLGLTWGDLGWLSLSWQEFPRQGPRSICAPREVVCYRRMHRAWPTSELGAPVKVIECHSSSGHWASRPWKALVWDIHNCAWATHHSNDNITNPYIPSYWQQR